MRLRDTKRLDRFWVSEALLDIHPELGEPEGEARELPLGEDGNLVDIGTCP
jgi:hypothetical protein